MPPTGRVGAGARTRDGATNDSASVVVSEVWQASGLGEDGQGFIHLLDGLIEAGWDCNAIASSQISRELEEVSGIHVVVNGLFEVKAIGADLGFGLFEDDLPAALLPAASLGDLRTHGADGEQGDAFAQQVGVGREVSREKVLDVPAVEVESGD